MSEDHVRVHIHVTGRVQRVYYRKSAAEMAQHLGLTGWVRNHVDGSVEAVAEGPRPVVEQFVAWCQAGPPASAVATVHAEWAPATGEFSKFTLRF
jgi:acylphosphatase